MNNKKKRILFATEFTEINTGYSKYAKEVLTRLHQTDKYILAEHARYCKSDHPAIPQIPWTVFPNMPDNKEEEQIYQQDPLNQFGKWRFNDVALQFRPDVVITHVDIWMADFMINNWLHNYYNLAYMVPVDSAPAQEGWLESYSDCEIVTSYSEYGNKYLQDAGNGQIKTRGITTHGVNTNVFKPIPQKLQLKEHFNLPKDSIVVGTVMRNQKRKLFPELIKSFAQFLEQQSQFRGKVFLYLHTSYPDLGFDIPRLIRESSVSRYILLTYICTKCGHHFCDTFKDIKTECPRCHNLSASIPNTQVGLTDEQLCHIYNLFDVYVQYSIAEALAIPQIEAAACGVYLMSVDYAAMHDVCTNVGGQLIKVNQVYRESETHQYRVYPDNNDLIDKLTKFCNLPQQLRFKKGHDCYIKCLQHYDWDKTIDKWIELLDSVECKNWDENLSIHYPNTQIPQGLSNDNLVRWGIMNLMGEPNKLNSYYALRLIRDLNYGHTIRNYGGSYISEDSVLGSQPRYRQFNQDDLIRELLDNCKERNTLEQRRCNVLKYIAPFLNKVELKY